MALPQDSVNANELSKVSTIPTGKELIFIDPTTNEGGVITLEDLTKQILQNLTSQTFALDQGTMTLLQALNQLNSKPLVKHGFIDGIECPANTITTVSLTYDKPFPRYPTVVCCLRSGTTMVDYGSLTVFVDYANSEKTGCNLKIANNSKYDLKPAIDWIAVSNQ